MKIFSILILSITILLCINTFLKGIFDRLTMYKEWEIHTLPGSFVVFYLFFGLLMFPFYKIIRAYRKRIYCETIVRKYNYWYMTIPEELRPKSSELTENEYYNCSRYLKLVKLNKKCKKFHLWAQ